MEIHKNAIPDNTLESIIDMIYDIKNPSLKEYKNAINNEVPYHIINKFYSVVKNITDIYNESYPVLNTTVETIRKIFNQTLETKYTEIIKNVKEIKNIHEPETMTRIFEDNMLKIMDYTNQIEKDGKDTENIYLTLDKENKNEAINLQNKRKLCELRIIDIMETVITNKSRIVKTEKCMLELINEIEKLHTQIEQKL